MNSMDITIARKALKIMDDRTNFLDLERGALIDFMEEFIAAYEQEERAAHSAD